MTEQFRAGQTVLVAMTVIDPNPQNDYRGLYYIMCKHPYHGQDGSTPEPVPLDTIHDAADFTRAVLDNVREEIRPEVAYALELASIPNI